MDPASLAGAVVALVVPYLQQLGGQVAKRVTDDAAGAAHGVIGRLYQTLKARLRHGSYAAGQLEGVEVKPDSLERRQALESALAAYLASRPELGAELARLVEEARLVRGMPAQAVDAGIAAGGSVVQWAGGDITGRDRIGGDQVGRDKTTYPLPQSDR